MISVDISRAGSNGYLTPAFLFLRMSTDCHKKYQFRVIRVFGPDDNKARIFLLVDLRDFFFRFRVGGGGGGDEKNNKNALEMTS